MPKVLESSLDTLGLASFNDALQKENSLTVGSRVRVLRGRNFKDFGTGDAGVILRMDWPSRMCDVAFDGHRAPLPVALRHLEIEPRTSNGPSFEAATLAAEQATRSLEDFSLERQLRDQQERIRLEAADQRRLATFDARVGSATASVASPGHGAYKEEEEALAAAVQASATATASARVTGMMEVASLRSSLNELRELVVHEAEQRVAGLHKVSLDVERLRNDMEQRTEALAEIEVMRGKQSELESLCLAIQKHGVTEAERHGAKAWDMSKEHIDQRVMHLHSKLDSLSSQHDQHRGDVLSTLSDLTESHSTLEDRLRNVLESHKGGFAEELSILHSKIDGHEQKVQDALSQRDDRLKDLFDAHGSHSSRFDSIMALLESVRTSHEQNYSSLDGRLRSQIDTHRGNMDEQLANVSHRLQTHADDLQRALSHRDDRLKEFSEVHGKHSSRLDSMLIRLDELAQRSERWGESVDAHKKHSQRLDSAMTRLDELSKMHELSRSYVDERLRTSLESHKGSMSQELAAIHSKFNDHGDTLRNALSQRDVTLAECSSMHRKHADRLDSITARLEELRQSHENIHKSLGQWEQRYANMDGRLGNMPQQWEQKLVVLDERIDGIIQRFSAAEQRELEREHRERLPLPTDGDRESINRRLDNLATRLDGVMIELAAKADREGVLGNSHQEVFVSRIDSLAKKFVEEVARIDNMIERLGKKEMTHMDAAQEMLKTQTRSFAALEAHVLERDRKLDHLNLQVDALAEGLATEVDIRDQIAQRLAAQSKVGPGHALKFSNDERATSALDDQLKSLLKQVRDEKGPATGATLHRLQVELEGLRGDLVKRQTPAIPSPVELFAPQSNNASTLKAQSIAVWPSPVQSQRTVLVENRPMSPTIKQEIPVRVEMTPPRRPNGISILPGSFVAAPSAQSTSTRTYTYGNFANKAR